MSGNRNAGRKPKPTKLKLLAGVSRRDRLNPAEPDVPQGDPECPPDLNGEALAEWVRISADLKMIGVLTQVDGRALAEYCRLHQTAVMISLEKSKPEFRVLITEPGLKMDGITYLKVKENPLIRMERQTAAALRGYFCEFGLTPSSRSRVKVAGKPQSKLDQFITA